MTHSEFVVAYRNGDVTVDIDRAAAGKFVSARLLLPVVRLPALGIGVALALTGWISTGLLIVAIGTVLPILIKRSAPHFVLTQTLQDSRFYDDAVAAGVVTVQKVTRKGDDERVTMNG